MYFLKRLLMLIPVIIGITFFIFLIMSVAPGDPARLILGVEATAAEVAAKREEMGLNDHVVLRYLRYMWGVLRGDFGISWFGGFSVIDEFLNRIPNTVILGLMSLSLSIVVGIPLGIIAAVRQYHVVDYVTLAGAMLFASMPAFWFGLMAQI
jgi:peptide/nickel transport system permease protein